MYRRQSSALQVFNNYLCIVLLVVKLKKFFLPTSLSLEFILLYCEQVEVLGQVASHDCICDTWFPFMRTVFCHHVALDILQTLTQWRQRHCQVTQWIKAQIHHTYHHTADWEFGTAGPTSKPHASQADKSTMSMSHFHTNQWSFSQPGILCELFYVSSSVAEEKLWSSG